jgi:hypothetical protein
MTLEDVLAFLGLMEGLRNGVCGGAGVLAGRDVACIAPEWLVAFRTGYDVDEDDWADVSALCAQFGIAVPDEYQRFRDRSLSDGR